MPRIPKGQLTKKLDNHPIFASDQVLIKPLSSSEIQAVRALLHREKERQTYANLADFSDGSGGKIDHTKLAERIYLARRHRERIFGDSLFAEPAWDLLLDLFIRAQCREQVSIGACHAAGVTDATALRYLKALTEKGYLERSSQSFDSRYTTVVISDLGRKLMIEWLEGLAQQN